MSIHIVVCVGAWVYEYVYVCMGVCMCVCMHVCVCVCVCVFSELSRNDKHFQALSHAFIIMIITGIAHSMLKDTVQAGM